MSTTTIDPTIAPPPPAPRSALPAGSRAPALVQAARFARDPLGFTARTYRRYGEPFTIRTPGFGLSVVFSSPDLVRQVVTGAPSVFHAGLSNAPLKPVAGPWSLLVLDRERHLSQRRLLLPPFHGERLNAYGALITELSEREVAGWPRGTPFRLAERMQRLTLDVIVAVVFGITETGRVDELRRRLPAFVISARRLVFWGTVATRDVGPIRPHATFVEQRAAIDALLDAEVAERRRAGDLASRSDILSMLVAARHEDGSPMSDAEIRDELMTLVLAGHETTATAATWAMDLLLRHPAVRDRVAADDGSDGTYLDAVCREVLRIRPVVPMVGRVVTEPVRIGTHELPAGTGLVASILLAHHRPDVFPQPEAFRPERFLTDGEVPSYGWLPFGGGVRRCIGASFAQFELATILRVLARSDVRLADERPEPIRATGVTLVPGRGVGLVR